jgi:hypothetical protein
MKSPSRPTIDLGYPTEPHGRIPAFHSVEEEAEFWDTHDTTDYEDEFGEGTLKISPEFRHVFQLPFEGRDFSQVSAYAQKRGIPLSTLLQIWIRERLQAETAIDSAVGAIQNDVTNGQVASGAD